MSKLGGWASGVSLGLSRSVSQERNRWARWISTLLTAAASLACSGSTPEPIGTEQQAIVPRACGTTCSRFVYPSNHTYDLIHVPDHEGDRVPDFSQVGYRRGAIGLPSEQLPPQGGDAPITITSPGWSFLVSSLQQEIDPLTGLSYCPNLTPASFNPPPTSTSAPSNICDQNVYDHGRVIQCLINRVARRPGTVKGRVYLPRGHYAIYSSLELQEGVVLRGVSAYGTGAPSTIHGCNKVSPLIGLTGGVDGVPTGPLNIIEHVPVGANSVVVANPHGFFVNQTVKVTRTACQPTPEGAPRNCPNMEQWAVDIGMPPEWALRPITFMRKITHIQPVEDFLGGSNRSRIFLDIPLTNALEARYVPHTIEGYLTPPTSPRNVGVMKLRGISHNSDPCAGKGSTCKVTGMIGFHVAEDSWIYDVVAEGFTMSAVTLGQHTRFVTVEDVSFLRPYGLLMSGGYRYAYFDKGTMNLVARVFSEQARHAHVPAEGFGGPRVVFDSDADRTHQEAGPHNCWATGTLFDNLRLNSVEPEPHSAVVNWSGGQLNAYNRGQSQGHGYSGANMVAWNTFAVAGYNYFNLPSAQNWLLGQTGGPIGDPTGSPGQSLPYTENFTGKVGKLVTMTSSGLPLPDSTIGDSLYRSQHYMYGPATYGNDELQIRHYLIGDLDNFTHESDIVTDQVYVNPAFRNWLGTIPTVPTSFPGFDFLTTSNGVADPNSIAASIRYDVGAGQSVVTAYLAVRTRLVGVSDWSHNFVQIAGAGNLPSDFSNARTFYWACGIGAPPSCQAVPADLTSPLGWELTAEPRVRVLELPRPVFSDILDRRVTSGGRTFGEINVNFARMTRVDWLTLTVVLRKEIPG